MASPLLPSDAESPPLRLTIRFATHQIPDLPLCIASAPTPTSTSTLSSDLNSSNPNSTSTANTNTLTLPNLRHAIRPHLPSTLQDKGLRLIHAGRVLEDSWSIAQALRLPISTEANGGGRWKGKGREQAGSGSAENGSQRADKSKESGRGEGHEVDVVLEAIYKDEAAGNIFSRVYVHCSISPSSISTTELGAEAIIGRAGDCGHITSQLGASNTQSTDTASQGFDRLLGPDFSSADVASLRAQFRRQVGERYTSHTMPMSSTLRRMEEAWLDGEGLGAGVGGSTGRGFDEEDSPRQQMYDTLLGVCTGFFWPLGAVCWGLREEGIWSRRRGMAVLAGVGVNVGFGLVRVLG